MADRMMQCCAGRFLCPPSALGLRSVRPVLVVVVLLATLLASLGFAAPAAGSEGALKVAIIVGPVGEELTPVYITLADAAATAAETRGATVARAYSPEATAEKVLAAVENANIVIYLGHGVGTPNPYSDVPSAETMNGWGLNGPGATGTHADSSADGSLAYYGEAWIAEHARPAPGWVMIYSNACYAPGASEGFDEPADEETAAGRVSAYSRAPLAELGASAYFATDFYAGAAHLVGKLLDEPDLPYGDVFASEPNYVAEGVARLPHALVDGAETWLQRSAYFEGKQDYWYAFAGDPTATLAGGGCRADAAIVAGRGSRGGRGRGHRHGVELQREHRLGGRADGGAAARARWRDPRRRAAGRARLRGPLRQPSRRRLLPVLRRNARPAGREPVPRGVGARHRHAARGGPRPGPGPPLPGIPRTVDI